MKSNKMRRTAIAVTAAGLATSGLAMFGAAPAHAEPTWLELESLNEIGTLPSNAEVAVNEDGKAVAIWTQKDGDIVRARASYRHPGGDWSPPVFLSKDGTAAQEPQVAINEAGQAVASWVRPVDGDQRLQLRHLSAAGAWSKVRTVSPEDQNVDHHTLDVTPKGAAMTAWSSGMAAHDKVRLARVDRDGSRKVWVLADDQGYQLDLDTNRTGQTVVLWREQEGDSESAVRARRLNGSTLGGVATLFTGNTYGAVSVSLNDADHAVAAYTRSLPDGSRIVAHPGLPAGGWGFGNFVSTQGSSAWNPDTAIAADGSQAITWTNEFEHIQATMRDLGEVWPASSLIGSGAETDGGSAVMNNAGDLAIAWTDAGPALRMLVRPAGENAYFAPAYESGSLMNGVLAHGIDGEGSVIEVHGAQLGDAGRMLSRVLDVAGPEVSMKPTRERVIGTTFNVGWAGSDRHSEVDSVEVLRRNAPWDGTFGLALPWTQDNGPTWAGVNSGEPGQTYCFAAIGTDSVGNEGSMSGWRCTTTPVDDRTPEHVGFTDEEGKGYYLGTYQLATEKGSKLILPGAKAKRIGLVVAKSQGHGKISVSFDGELLGTWSLGASKTKKKQKILVADLGSIETGNLVIKVISDGKPVVIDGIHVIK